MQFYISLLQLKSIVIEKSKIALKKKNYIMIFLRKQSIYILKTTIIE